MSRQLQFRRTFSIHGFSFDIEYLFVCIVSLLFNPIIHVGLAVSADPQQVISQPSFVIVMSIMCAVFSIWFLRIFRVFFSEKASSEYHDVLNEVYPDASKFITLRYSRKSDYSERSTLFQSVLFVPRQGLSDPLVREKLAHELAHVANRDYATYWVYNYLSIGLLLMVLAGIVNGTYFTAGTDGLTDGQLSVLWFGMSLPVILIAFLVYRRAVFLRRREHRADISAFMVRGLSYMKLLKRIQRMGRISRQVDSPFKNHPKIEQRIEAVQTKNIPVRFADVIVYFSLVLLLIIFCWMAWSGLNALFLATSIHLMFVIPLVLGLCSLALSLYYAYLAHAWMFQRKTVITS